MTLILKTKQVNASDGLSVDFYDLTGTTGTYAYGVGGNITYVDIDAVRIKVGTATTLQAATTITYGSNFTQFHEYVKTVGSSATVDSKAMVVGSVFVPQVASIAVPSGDTWEATGYYVPQIIATWLPAATEVALNLEINELGQSGSLVEDNIYVWSYEIYKDVVANPSTATTPAVSGTEYLVVTGTVTYNSNVYRKGEHFAGIDTNTITIATSSSIAKMDSTVASYVSLLYALTVSILANIEVKMATGSDNYKDAIYAIKSQLDSLNFSDSTLNVDFTKMTDFIAYLQAQVDFLDNNSI